MSDSTPNHRQVQEWIDKQPETGPQPDLSIVIPAYNEQWRLPTTLIDVIDLMDTKGLIYEVIVVDDGSSDDTCEMVRKFEKIRPQLRLISYPRNHGKGYAVRTGILNARGKRILFMDADGATSIKEIDRLMRAMDSGAEVAIGSRAKTSSETHVKTHWYRKIIGRIFNFLVNLLLIPEIADTQCGFKLFSRDAARFIFKVQRADGFSFDVELLYLAKKIGLKISEVPVNWQNVPGSKVNLLLDSTKMFLDILLYRFKHRLINKATYTTFLSSAAKSSPSM